VLRDALSAHTTIRRRAGGGMFVFFLTKVVMNQKKMRYLCIAFENDNIMSNLLIKNKLSINN
jgi:hypothetical protein